MKRLKQLNKGNKNKKKKQQPVLKTANGSNMYLSTFYMNAQDECKNTLTQVKDKKLTQRHKDLLMKLAYSSVDRSISNFGTMITYTSNKERNITNKQQKLIKHTKERKEGWNL